MILSLGLFILVILMRIRLFVILMRLMKCDYSVSRSIFEVVIGLGINLKMDLTVEF